MVISASVLKQLLEAAPRENDRPTLTSAQFERATFQGGLFVGVRFKGEATFFRANFQREAWFFDTTFHDKAWFDGASFQQGAAFTKACFQREARFRGASFQGEASFSEASFQGGASFSEANFQRGVWFDRASFQREVGFHKARFQGEALFGATSFQGMASFDGVSFQKEIWFDGTNFHDVASFDGASFDRATQVGPLLARQLVLDSAVFGARAKLEVSAAAICARRGQFPGGIHMQLRYASVVLDDANLAPPTRGVACRHQTGDGRRDQGARITGASASA